MQRVIGGKEPSTEGAGNSAMSGVDSHTHSTKWGAGANSWKFTLGVGRRLPLDH